MLLKVSVAVCWLVVVVHGQKWVWGNNSGRDGLRGEHSVARPYVNRNTPTPSAPLFQAATKKQKLLQSPQSDDPGGDPRYEVFENGNGPGGPNDLPPRPPVRPPTQYQGRPPLRPPTQYPGRPPITRPGEGNFLPEPPLPPPSRPRPPPPPPPPGGRPELGILTGPVPSWEGPPPLKNNDPTSFESCKCVNSFNCKSPGLKFGSCDVGKSYCCYNSPGYGIYADGAGSPQSFGAKGDGPPVLAGPQGPVDRPGPGFRRPPGPSYPDGPPFGRPPPPPGLGPLPFDIAAPRSATRGSAKDRKKL